MRKVYEPREYQRDITRFIIDHPRCNVFADMGLGKTAATLTAYDLLRECDMVKGPLLVLAPIRVARTTWPDEADKWRHLDGHVVQPIVGDRQSRQAALQNKRATVFTVNYENVPWLVNELGDKWPFRMVVADESTRLKSFRLKQGGARARALGAIAHTKIERFVNLSGTPSPNGVIDLWGQVWFVDAGRRLGRSFSAFLQRWFQKSFNGFTWEPLPFSQGQIQVAIKDISIHIDAADYFNLEDPIESTIYVDLPPKAREAYREMEREMYTEIKGLVSTSGGVSGTHAVESVSAASRTMKCLQLANGAAYVGEPGEKNNKWVEVHDAKIEALREVVEEAAGAPVLVGYHFRSDLARILAAFPKAEVLTQDPAVVRRWNKGEISLLVAHPASAGHGLNLQDGGNRICFFGHNWNLEEYDQFVERLGPTRQAQAGHKRPVYIHHIVARGTVEEAVMERLVTKRSIQDILLESLKREGEAHA